MHLILTASCSQWMSMVLDTNIICNEIKILHTVRMLSCWERERERTAVNNFNNFTSFIKHRFYIHRHMQYMYPGWWKVTTHWNVIVGQCTTSVGTGFNSCFPPDYLSTCWSLQVYWCVQKQLLPAISVLFCPVADKIRTDFCFKMWYKVVFQWFLHSTIIILIQLYQPIMPYTICINDTKNMVLSLMLRECVELEQ